MNPGSSLRLACLLSIAFAAVPSSGHAQESGKRWFARMDIQALNSNYSDSQQRDALRNAGLFLRWDYLERGGVTLGFNRTQLSFDESSGDIDQDNWFVSARVHTTPDWANGQVSYRLDAHVVSNDDPTNAANDVSIFAPQVSFINYARTFYMDLGYSKSSYGDSVLVPEPLDVEQWTPTLGFGSNDQRGWLQLRAYLIEPSSAARAQNAEDTAALQISYTRWLAERRFLGIDNLRFSALVGERVYAVDPDAAGVYNLSDLQTGGASVGAEWAPGQRTRILLLLGLERYEDRNLDDQYDSPFAYLNFTYMWD